MPRRATSPVSSAYSLTSSASSSVPFLSRRPYLSPILALFIATCFAAWLWLVVQATLPRTLQGEWPPELKLPRTLHDLQHLGIYLQRYTAEHYVRVSTAFVSLYIFLQTFLVPGSIMLSVLAGALFGVPVGLLYVAIGTAIGASNCYLLSKYLAGQLLQRMFGHKMARWQGQLYRQRNHLFNYMIFLRVTPILPNWFINLAAPHLGFPLPVFFMGTFFGVMPPSLVHVQAGKMLPQLQDLNHLLTFGNVVTLLLVGVIALLPILLQRWFGGHDRDESVQYNVVPDDTLASSSTGRLMQRYPSDYSTLSGHSTCSSNYTYSEGELSEGSAMESGRDLLPKRHSSALSLPNQHASASTVSSGDCATECDSSTAIESSSSVDRGVDKGADNELRLGRPMGLGAQRVPAV